MGGCTAVAIAGGDLGRGVGFLLLFFVLFYFVLVQRGGCKDTEFKDASCEKVETLKKCFCKNFPICMYSTGFPASKVRFTPFLNKTLI